MKKLLLVIGLLSLAPASTLAQAQTGNATAFSSLNNRDIVAMVEQHMAPLTIVREIQKSSCTFDTFPPVMRDLQRRGVPDVVLEAMTKAPYGPATSATPAAELDELAEAPIYHYTEQLKQMGVLGPSAGRRAANSRRARARRSSTRRTSM